MPPKSSVKPWELYVGNNSARRFWEDTTKVQVDVIPGSNSGEHEHIVMTCESVDQACGSCAGTRPPKFEKPKLQTSSICVVLCLTQATMISRNTTVARPTPLPRTSSKALTSGLRACGEKARSRKSITRSAGLQLQQAGTGNQHRNTLTRKHGSQPLRRFVCTLAVCIDDWQSNAFLKSEVYAFFFL